MRILLELALAIGILAPLASAQKPPAPAPPPTAPPPTSPGRPINQPSTNPTFGESATDFVMYLEGRVTTDDGTAVPHDVMIERVCNAGIRQQVYASARGEFTMDLATRADKYVDASAEGNNQDPQTPRTNNNGTERGIPRRELSNCELRASVSGFRSNVISLMDLTPTSSSVDVGSITVHRTTKVKGLTVSASSYNAPKDARRAYEQGLQAEKKGNLAGARQDFEKACNIYPKYTSAWFRLGGVLQKLKDNESARTAYARATAIDNKFLPPYLPLAEMAFEAKAWNDVLMLSNHVVDQDPLRYADVTGYIVDLDSLDYAQAYFYNSAANYMLNKFAEAEKSGLRAERLDVRPRFPQLHLLLAQIFAHKNDYATAISETKIYLELRPNSEDAVQVREQLAKFQKLNGPLASSEKTDQN